MWVRGQQHFMLPVLVIIHLEDDNEYRNYNILFLTILCILFGFFRLLFVQIACCNMEILLERIDYTKWYANFDTVKYEYSYEHPYLYMLNEYWLHNMRHGLLCSVCVCLCGYEIHRHRK